MKLVKLLVHRHGKHIIETYSTVTEAYHRYLSKYATIQEWFYYWRCCGLRLNQVTDEETMVAISVNVFHKAIIVKERI